MGEDLPLCPCGGQRTTLMESNPSFNTYVGSEDKTQVSRFAGKHPYLLSSHTALWIFSLV